MRLVSAYCFQLILFGRIIIANKYKMLVFSAESLKPDPSKGQYCYHRKVDSTRDKDDLSCLLYGVSVKEAYVLTWANFVMQGVDAVRYGINVNQESGSISCFILWYLDNVMIYWLISAVCYLQNITTKCILIYADDACIYTIRTFNEGNSSFENKYVCIESCILNKIVIYVIYKIVQELVIT